MVKQRFPVQTVPVEYSFQFKKKLVIAICAIHNLIRFAGHQPDLFEMEAETERLRQLDENENEGDWSEMESGQVAPGAKNLRDGIAQRMWDDYLRCKEKRAQRRRNKQD